MTGCIKQHEFRPTLMLPKIQLKSNTLVTAINGENVSKMTAYFNIYIIIPDHGCQAILHKLVIGIFRNYGSSLTQFYPGHVAKHGYKQTEDAKPERNIAEIGCRYFHGDNRMNKGEITMKSKIDQWPKLIKGTKENDIETVKQLLLDTIPILPLSSTTDPLREAIQRGNIELTMLLLSAGAPLCGRPLVGLNSLEISHSAPGLTVFLPALIRREFYNCLRSESEMIFSNDSNLVQLKHTVINLSESVRKNGYENTNWKFSTESTDRSERSKEARKMLMLAASVGMGLTCQILGLEDVFLHPLPFENSPDIDAKPNALVIFCRDLDLSLSLKDVNISSHLKEEYEEYNFQKLRKFCKQNLINFNSLHNKETPVNKKVLKYIAEQGLDITYKKIFRAKNAQIVDLIMDDVTGFTMLHSAAYNGRMGMVEYLLFNKANDKIKTKKGFTAAHVAAMRGHKECMEYILAFSKLPFSKLNQNLIKDQTESGLTAHQISVGYASEVTTLAPFLLHVNESYTILSEPTDENKVKLILNAKKSVIKECLSKGSLDHIISLGYINEQQSIWQQLKDEAEHFITKLMDTDSRFKGKTIKHYRNEDALELLLMDSYQIYLEIENYEYWEEKDLLEAFIKSGNKALQDYTVKSRNLCLSKDFKPTLIGANLFLTYCSRQITTHISIRVIPVFKVNLDLNTDGLQLSKIFHDIAKTSVAHITKTKSGKWSYITVDLEKQLFAKVDSSKMLVLSVCRFIKKILYPHWWFPRLETRRHGRQWHHNAVSLQSVSERLLISCFLREVFKFPEEKWDNSNVLDRVLGIFNQMLMQDKGAGMEAKCFLDPGKEQIKVSTNILVIIDFLKEFRK
ncbi:unnamed protein product, partial [Meganyctiphanes norvegica]